jgi:hypothetical protein
MEVPVNDELHRIHQDIIRQHTPPSGWCDGNQCPTCQRAEAFIDEQIAEATRQYYADETSGDSRALQDAYDVGFVDGKRNGMQTATSIARTQVDAAYRRGVKDGQAAASCPTCAAGAPSATAYYDKVLNECHIIGESNPQMKPAMNALRHRIKKLSR